MEFNHNNQLNHAHYMLGFFLYIISLINILSNKGFDGNPSQFGNAKINAHQFLDIHDRKCNSRLLFFSNLVCKIKFCFRI